MHACTCAVTKQPIGVGDKVIYTKEVRGIIMWLAKYHGKHSIMSLCLYTSCTSCIYMQLSTELCGYFLGTNEFSPFYRT